MSKIIACFRDLAAIINSYELTNKEMEEVIQMIQYGLQRSIDTGIIVMEVQEED